LFNTLFWIGRYVERTKVPWEPIDRKDVKMCLCHAVFKIKDPNIRAAIISRYSDREDLGGGKIPEIGIKANPGPLFGFSADLWAALGVAITYCENKTV